MKSNDGSPFTVALVAYDDDQVPGWVQAQIEEAGIRLLVGQCASGEEAVALATGADVAWVMGGSKVLDADVLRRLPVCGAVLRTGSGTDNIPVQEATRLGVYACNTPEVAVDPVAEQTFGLILAVARGVAWNAARARAGTWAREGPRGRVLGATLGVVGFGRIGRRVAEVGQGFGMRVRAFDPCVTGDVMSGLGVEAASMEDLPAASDFVSVHTSLTEATFHLIDEQFLGRMKPGAVLINTSRGSVVDEPALIRALEAGRIGGAGLDVLEQEPPRPDNPLLEMENVVVTPHDGGCAPDHPFGFWRDSVRAILEMSRSRVPPWFVNPNVEPRWGRSAAK